MQHTRHYRLSELSQQIKQVLSVAFNTASFWVIADVTNHTFKTGNRTHYFELVEQDALTNNIIARLTCKAWGNGSDNITLFEQATGQVFSNNIHVLVNVSVQFHPVFGLQLNLNGIDPHFTMGVLERQKQDTLRLLVSENPTFITKSADGYLTRNNQLQLKPVIRHIALIAAQTSAGAEDFRHTLEYNHYGYTFTIDDYYTPVQGAGNAELLLAKIIEVFRSGKDYDAVVLVRGGGAQTDFLLFDDYKIGRAIAKFPIPFLTGIGHQKNETIADLMAHTQTKTPTKAAEFILAHNKTFEDAITTLQKDILIKAQQLLARQTARLNQYNTQVLHYSRDIIAMAKERLSYNRESIIRLSGGILSHHRNALTHTAAVLFSKPVLLLHKRGNDVAKGTARVKAAQLHYFSNQNNRLVYYHSLIRIMAPENILKKGFALIKVNDRIVGNADDIYAGTDIQIILGATQIKATVTQKSPYESKDTNL